VKYNREDLNSTIRTAQALSIQSGLTWFVFATAQGYGVYKEPPAFHQGYYAIKGVNVEPVNRND